MARIIAAAAAVDRGELPEDSCLAPLFGLAGFLGLHPSVLLVWVAQKDEL